MGNKKITKEDDIERKIRALLKLPENKRCINCNLLGPQYVCTTFMTFVCTTCSGIHREFTHRVKSISMAKFSEEEVNALQAAGNERAREVYFRAWDPQRYPLPDNSNLHKLRDFIKHVYVDGKFTGERPPNVRPGNRADSSESRKVSVFSGGQKSPLYENRQERSPNRGSSPSEPCNAPRGYYSERRSPQYAQDNSRYGGLRRNHTRIEIVDNRIRNDGSRTARHRDKQSFSPREPVTRSELSDHKKKMDSSGSPLVRSLKDIWGEENSSKLEVVQPKANAVRDPEGSAVSQAAPSGGMVSLIDFSMDSEPSDAVAAQKTHQVPSSSDGGNQLSVEISSKEKAAPASSANSLDLLLFDLSDPSSVSVNNVSPVQGTADAPSTAFGQNISLDRFFSGEPSAQILALTSTVGYSTVPTAINVQQNHSNLLPGTSSQLHNAQQSSNASNQQLSQATSKPAEETSSNVGAQPLSAETKSSGRTALPEDLFSISYATAPAAIPGWQSGPQHGTGFGLQYYPNAMQAAAIRGTVNANPFDLNRATIPAQVQSFPSMASLQGLLPSVQAPIGSLHTSSTEANSLGTESHSSYLTSLMTPDSHFTSSVPSSTYMGDQSHINVPPSRPQGINDFGSEIFMSDSFGTNQRPAGGDTASNSPNSFHTMG